MPTNSINTNPGQVLGAATAVGGAVASLPATGDNRAAFVLLVLSAVLGAAVLASFVVTRIAKRFI